MNAIDIFILAVLLFFAFKGLMRGLVNEIASLAGLVLGGWLAYQYYPALSVQLRNFMPIPAHFSAFLAFVAILMLTGVASHMLGNILTTALRMIMLGSLNRLGGVIAGATEGCLLLCMIFYICNLGMMPQSLKNSVMSSYSGGAFAAAGESILSTLPIRGKILKP